MSIFGKLGILNKIFAPIRIHTHEIPRCGGGHHNAECKGPEIICRVMFKGDKRFCVCVHLKV